MHEHTKNPSTKTHSTVVVTLRDMAADMIEQNSIARQPYGKAALKKFGKKLGKVPKNFRLCGAAWIGRTPENWVQMRVTGGEFRAAQSGPNAGKLCIMIPGSKRTILVSTSEIGAAGRD